MTEEHPEEKNDLKDPVQTPEPSELELLAAKVAELEAGIGQYKDQLLRKAAEFENYKKRAENEYATLVRYSNEDLILKLLPVLDDFERSFKAGRGSAGSANGRPEPDAAARAGDDSFLRGMELIYQKFRKIIDALGVRPIEVVGKPFDPHLHDALLQIPRAGVPPHTVIEEVDKGYMLNDKVLRHAKVVVSADAAPGDDASGEDGRGSGESLGRS